MSFHINFNHHSLPNLLHLSIFIVLTCEDTCEYACEEKHNRLAKERAAANAKAVEDMQKKKANNAAQ